ncbi:MAG: serine/threonine protein kinase [Candidatus Brocadiia bacterium]
MEKIGKYVIESKLGQGGMGIVYKCLDPETGRHTAVKVLPQQMTASPSFLQRFKREVLTLQRLDHPNIVRIYDDGEWEGAYYYAMEYVEGVGLDSILADKERMPPLEALHIIRACAAALQHSHARAVIHRDIKPANIMIASDGSVKLMDFGIAKVLDATRMTETLSVLGTVEYMSPEQSQGRYVDAHSDLYSLGVVLYQCLTARVPISGTTPTEVIMKLRTHQIEPPSAWTPGLPKSLDALVMHLLERDTSKRLASAAELIREIERVEHHIKAGAIGHGPIASADRLPLTGQTATPLWRNPWAIGFLALAAGIVLWIALRPAPPPPVAVAAPEQEHRPPAVIMAWARKAQVDKRYDYAEDLCHLLMKYWHGTKEAQRAQELLKTIQEARAVQAAPPNAPNPAPAKQSRAP